MNVIDNEVLDYEIVQSDEGDFEVWTPDCNSKSGACIGIGKTRKEAAQSAITCMSKTITALELWIKRSGQ